MISLCPLKQVSLIPLWTIYGLLMVPVAKNDCERPSLNQLKQYILYLDLLVLLCFLGDTIRCDVSADLKMVARNRPLGNTFVHNIMDQPPFIRIQ